MTFFPRAVGVAATEGDVDRSWTLTSSGAEGSKMAVVTSAGQGGLQREGNRGHRCLWPAVEEERRLEPAAYQDATEVYVAGWSIFSPEDSVRHLTFSGGYPPSSGGELSGAEGEISD